MEVSLKLFSLFALVAALFSQVAQADLTEFNKGAYGSLSCRDARGNQSPTVMLYGAPGYVKEVGVTLPADQRGFFVTQGDHNSATFVKSYSGRNVIIEIQRSLLTTRQLGATGSMILTVNGYATSYNCSIWIANRRPLH